MKTFVLPIIALSTLLAMPAYAGNVEFAYQRAELATPAGVAALHERIARVAMKDCDIYQNARLDGIAYKSACASDLADGFVGKIGDRRLSRLHENMQTEILAKVMADE